jgi:hypothetical protein
MTRDQLRAALQNGADRLLGLPHFILHQDDRNLIYGCMVYWIQADDATIDKLLHLMEVVPHCADTKPKGE